MVGAGLMGAQIGAEYAIAGHDVILVTRSAATGATAMQRAQAAIRALVSHGLLGDDRAASALPRLSTAQDVRAACAGRDVVVESVAEELNAKADVLDAAARAAPDATLCSNTSSIQIAQLGEAARAPDRVLGTHYANPAILMPLVEVIPSAHTERRRVDEVVRLLEGVGKTPMVVPDVPGFLWNRLQFALLREAARLVVEHGVDPATVDLAVRRTLGRRWSLVGPFETMALGGRETFVKIAKLLFDEVGKPVDPSILERVDLPPPESLRALAADRDARLIRWRKDDLEEGTT
ncbi:MAG TPA: 3-hydroxyacyl-CoA dehydrogenase family protein [Candidatus Limnocylindria bacterium]|nr:3-hydroxyacyl-CoA dehydrogenase family protein [Candidatus Limnocylindria bacterium]